MDRVSPLVSPFNPALRTIRVRLTAPSIGEPEPAPVGCAQHLVLQRRERIKISPVDGLAELDDRAMGGVLGYPKTLGWAGTPHMEPIPLEPIDALSITVLVDNVTDSLLADMGPAKRAPMRSDSQVPASMLVGERTDDALLAEHGFSALVTIAKGESETRVLFDAGRTPDGMVENMRRLGLSPREIDIIVLSHGHWDHTTGMDGLVRELGRTNVPVLIHPEFWSRRRVVISGREPVELPSTSRSALEGAGFEIAEERQPSFLLGGSLLVTGEVDRTTEFERGFPGHEAHRHGEWRPDPLILDDQALVANLRGHGLVLLTGCGHSGIVNILRYVRRLTGQDHLHAVIGGFHLSGPAFEPIIGPTCDALAELRPDYLVPAHCTGWRAIHALAARFPDEFIPNAVGTRFEFQAALEPRSEAAPPQRT